jgi:hypothetical protein
MGLREGGGNRENEQAEMLLIAMVFRPAEGLEKRGVPNDLPGLEPGAEEVILGHYGVLIREGGRAVSLHSVAPPREAPVPAQYAERRRGTTDPRPRGNGSALRTKQ